MKTIKNIRDLKEFGIECLTGEACQIGARMLCDLTHSGRALVAETFGIVEHTTAFAKPWNNGVASCMIPYKGWDILAIMGLFKQGAICVVELKSEYIGIWEHDTKEVTEDDIKEFARVLFGFDGKHECCQPIHVLVEKLRTAYGDSFVRSYSPIGGPAVGLRSVHQMTGRTE